MLALSNDGSAKRPRMQNVLISTRQMLAAVSYNVSPRIVLDAGTAWGLNSASPNTALFSGITVPFN